MKLSNLKFIISPNGEISMEVLDGDGDSCLLTTKEIEQHLMTDGTTESSSGKKPEFYSGGSVQGLEDIFNGEG